jgi:general secretion pathway protein I
MAVKNACTVGGKSGGFSLLEVILALAILTGAVAVLGEIVRLGIRNAQVARDTTQAQLLCESKLAEITAGIIPSDPVPRDRQAGPAAGEASCYVLAVPLDSPVRYRDVGRDRIGGPPNGRRN